jgi:outer membrane protein OmpA-like peptidoglycan-associated protein
MIRRLTSLAAALAVLAPAALADTVLHYREGQRVDPQAVAQILGGQGAAPMKTRSIRMLDAPETAAAAAPSGGPAQDGAPAHSEAAARVPSVVEASFETPSARALSLPVRFEFNSAEISPMARPQLDALADGIKLLPRGQAIVIEGHTDAVGGEAYNLQLSQRRAQAVKRYLREVHAIEASRLIDVGFGKQRPIEGVDPYAGQNRRVQFRGA